MTGPPQCLVSTASATSCLPSTATPDRSIAIARTHSDLVKFASHDNEYDKVVFALEQIQGSADQVGRSHSSSV